jgi:hypothetical protein
MKTSNSRSPRRSPHQRDDADRKEEQGTAQLPEPGLQRRLALLGAGQKVRDPPQLGLHPGGQDLPLGRPGGDRGPHEDGVVPLGQRRVGRHPGGRFLGRQALAGQRGFVGREGVRLGDAGIGGDHVPGLEQEQVTGHHLRRRHLLRPAIAPDARAGRGHGSERQDRLLGAIFLEEPDQRVEN